MGSLSAGQTRPLGGALRLELAQSRPQFTRDTGEDGAFPLEQAKELAEESTLLRVTDVPIKGPRQEEEAHRALPT